MTRTEQTLHGLFVRGWLRANSPELVWTLGVQSKQNEKCSLTHLPVHRAHLHLPLLAPIQLFSAPIRAPASLTSLSQRQITALTFSSPMWKGCAGPTHRKQGSVSPQLPLTRYLKYAIGQLPQIAAPCQEILRESH